MERMKSLYKNGILNIIKTFSSMVFPLATFMYASRILGDTGIGKVNFVKSIISYFAMFAMLGMNYYGTREAAKLRDNKSELSQFVQEMLMINGCMTILSCILAFLCFISVPRIKEYEWIFIISSLTIPLQGLGMEWLYQALEEYRYITIRSILFQIVAFILMLAFVRKSDDTVAYTATTVLAGSGSYIMNFINARHIISFSMRRKLEIKKHIKPLLWLFAQAVAIELYTVLDSTMLGFLQGDAAVGRYTAAVKSLRFVNSLIVALGVVLIPRLSYYIGRGETDRVRILVRKAYNYTFLFSIPASVGLFLLSDEIILLLSGSGFSIAKTTMKIMTPIVFFIPFSTATNHQFFVPMKKEKLILVSTLAGAVTNFTFNLILIPRYAENGAAIATVMAETVVTLICLVNAKKFFDMKLIFKSFFQYWIAVLPVPVIVWLFRKLLFKEYRILGMSVAIIVSAITYFAILYALKNEMLISILKKIHWKVKNKKSND